MASPSVPAGEEVYRVTTLELFFDLVFVFAVTQLSHVLVKELNVLGLLQVVLMFGVLWWMYGGYAWLTNTLTPTTTGRRLLLLVGMGGFFMVALATPTASKGGGILWGLGYLVLVLAHVTLYAQGNPHIRPLAGRRADRRPRAGGRRRAGAGTRGDPAGRGGSRPGTIVG